MIYLSEPVPREFASSAIWEDFFSVIQANILKHHGRDNCQYVFIRFTDGQQRARIKAWIAAFAGQLTTAWKQLNAHRGEGPEEILCTCLISREGLAFLEVDQVPFPETAYDAIYDLSKDRDNIDDFFREPSHLMILIAHVEEGAIRHFFETQVQHSLARQGVDCICHIEMGVVKRNALGQAIEAFGFRDGISQPQMLQEKIPETNADQWSPGANLDLVLFKTQTNGMEDYGAFAAYLKIDQHPNLFEQNVQKIADEIQDAGLTPGQKKDLAAAYMMGRFRDGTPLMQANVQRGGQDLNNFNYGDLSRQPSRCPFFAHTFKANPRTDGHKEVRILRRGTPYSTGDGLHFLSYQRHLEQQFLVIYRDWIGHAVLPSSSGWNGKDPILMRDDNPSQPGKMKPVPREWGKAGDYFRAGVLGLQKPTTLRGAVLYYVPSIVFLKNIQSL